MAKVHRAPKPLTWRHHLRRICLLALVGLMVLIALVYAYGWWELRSAIAETDQLHPGWRLADILAARESIRDEENAATLVLQLHQKHELSERAKVWGSMDELFEQLAKNPECQLDPESLSQIAAVATEIEPIAVDSGQLRKMGRGRFPFQPAADYMNTHTECQKVRPLLQVLRINSIEFIERRDGERAAQNVIAILNAGSAIGDEPTMIAQLVRKACQQSAFETLERLLGQCEIDNDTLLRIQQRFQYEATCNCFLTGMKGERAWLFGYLEYLKGNSWPDPDPKVQKLEDRSWLILLSGIISLEQAKFLRYLNELVQFAELPPEDRHVRMWQLQGELANAGSAAFALAPAFPKEHTAFTYADARLRSAITAIAAERYRLRHAKWPTAITDLLESGFINAIPINPWDGKPLRWTTSPNGPVVYSVGGDLEDNGGRIIRDADPTEGIDCGFRLYDPDKRRQPPRPVKPKEPAEGPVPAPSGVLTPGSGPPP